MTPGTFILSLDCEGKWGVADILNAGHHRDLGDRQLRSAYAAIAAVLDEFDIAATFAVVGLFGCDQQEFRRLPFTEIGTRLPYTKGAVDDILRGSSDGWHADWLDEVIAERHERACHGVTHTPFDQLDDDQFAYEFSLPRRADDRTIVFPRNAVGHLDKLRGVGIDAYRAASADGAILRLAKEIVPRMPSERPMTGGTGGMLPIPAGYFVNWKSGARGVIPTSWTRLRAQSILDHAAEYGGVAHFWTHPENIASAPATLDNLRNICKAAARLRDAGRLQVVTQAGYLERATAAAPAERV
jgi:peptidoglycan/xylan/chitin deacetylase (PgdA/CDA1 family)